MFDTKWTVILPVRKINAAILGACRYTAYNLGVDLRDYILLRFSDPKHGRIYFLPGYGGLGRRFYRASAPGEYPAIRYGVLYQAMQVSSPDNDLNAGRCHVGVAPFSKAVYGSTYAPPDAHYAADLEGLTGAGPVRPYLRRAVTETSSQRPLNATAHFVSSLYGYAMQNARRNRSPVLTGGSALQLLPALGPNFQQIAREIASGSASTMSGEDVFRI